VTIIGMGPRGWGIARHVDSRIHVFGALPGDRVKARVVNRHRGRIEAEVVTYRSRALAPIPARCSHFAICGGCLWQDLVYEDQLDLKRKMVKGCLVDVGLTDVDVLETIESESVFEYRNKVEYSFSPDGEGKLVTGLHVSSKKWKQKKSGSRTKERLSRRLAGSPPVLEVERCHLLPGPLDAVARETGRALREAGIEAYDPEDKTGAARSIVVRRSLDSGQILVNLVTGVEETETGKIAAEALRSDDSEVAGVVRSWNPKRSRQAEPEKQVVEAGADRVVEKLGGLEIEVSSSSFMQVNTRQAERLYKIALSAAALTSSTRVLDLFSGIGALSLLAAGASAHVTGVEIREDATADARRNAERNGIENVRFVAGDVHDALAGELAEETFDVVLANPPRAGITKRALEAICGRAPERIVYVSCDAETLARDLVRLVANGYAVFTVQPVDMFPHTPHCEVVVELRRNA